ncbi:MAG: hypothetical protein R3260_00885 [Pseudomonas sp.]|nr:hypothetical protein [Pseudomonas sp.]
MTSASKNKKGRFLPSTFDNAHDLCFSIHDVMVQILVSGEEGNFFTTRVELKSDEEHKSLVEADDIFSWLEKENRLNDRANILKTTILPAVLSDMMHCVFECLENSRKAKLGISFMLIRKPLQESLYLLESIVLDELNFSETLAADPLKLRSQNAGGVSGHATRINNVLGIIGESSRLDAEYIAQLRYDKSSGDSFDGVCNHAMHLFTEHKAIRTEQLNINFIFSGWSQKITQWNYLYSRLPYLLFYTHKIVEHIVASIAPTSQDYLDDIQRRLASSIMLWWKHVDARYKCDQLSIFVKETEHWLNSHCVSSGYRLPNDRDLLRMITTGAYPSENLTSLKKRNLKYKFHALINKVMAKH